MWLRCRTYSCENRRTQWDFGEEDSDFLTQKYSLVSKHRKGTCHHQWELKKLLRSTVKHLLDPALTSSYHEEQNSAVCSLMLLEPVEYGLVENMNHTFPLNWINSAFTLVKSVASMWLDIQNNSSAWFGFQFSWKVTKDWIRSKLEESGSSNSWSVGGWYILTTTGKPEWKQPAAPWFSGYDAFCTSSPGDISQLHVSSLKIFAVMFYFSSFFSTYLWYTCSSSPWAICLKGSESHLWSTKIHKFQRIHVCSLVRTITQVIFTPAKQSRQFQNQMKSRFAFFCLD